MTDFSDDLMMVLVSHGTQRFEDWVQEYKKIEQFGANENLHKKARVIYTLIGKLSDYPHEGTEMVNFVMLFHRSGLAAMRKICRFDSPPFVGGLDLISRGFIVQPCRVDFYEVSQFNRFARLGANFEERMFYVSSHGTKDHELWLETYTRVNESEDSLEAPLEFTPIAIGRNCSEEVWAASDAEMAIRKRIYCTTIDVAFGLQDGFCSEQVREARIRMSCKVQDVQGSVNAPVNASSEYRERGGATSPSADEAGGGGDGGNGSDGGRNRNGATNNANTERSSGSNARNHGNQNGNNSTNCSSRSTRNNNATNANGRNNGSSGSARGGTQNMLQIETDFVASIRTNEGIRGPVGAANIAASNAAAGAVNAVNPGTVGVGGIAATGESEQSGVLCRKCIQCEDCKREACRARRLLSSTGTFPRSKLADVNRMVMNFAVNPVIQPHIRSGLILPPFTPYYGDLCNIIRTYENWPQAGSSTDGDPIAASGSADSGGSGGSQ